MLIQGMYALGAIPGIMFFSMMADRKGRRYAFLFCFTLLGFGCILMFIGIFFRRVPLIMTGQVICGFSSNAGMNISYTFASDLAPDVLRQSALIYYYYGWYIFLYFRAAS